MFAKESRSLAYCLAIFIAAGGLFTAPWISDSYFAMIERIDMRYPWTGLVLWFAPLFFAQVAIVCIGSRNV